MIEIKSKQLGATDIDKHLILNILDNSSQSMVTCV